MPECYTNAHVAKQALTRSGHTMASHPAFLAGANGPDPFFMYQYPKAKILPNLRALGARIHHENTGAFLVTLLRHATTPVQQSYAIGFVAHYATCCTLNPYAAAMTAPGMPYSEANGIYHLATSMDSEIYFRDYKTLAVPLHAGTPVLITEELAQVTTLLRDALKIVYGKDIPQVVLAEMFHDNLRMRRLLASRTGLSRLRVKTMAPGRPARYGGPLAHRTQPGKRLRRLPQTWNNPFSDEEMNLTFEEVLTLAEQTGAICVSAAMRYLVGNLDEFQLYDIIGNNDYHTGLPCKQPEGAAKSGERK